ncbi:Thialysine N-epsilon-acetyltransferase [Halotydeus destructor]|nr:Thialysine N-epsilon-acetyltransferase [Halotydeus destructor]
MSVIIRDTRKGDLDAIRSLIQELADYEKMPYGPKLTVNDLIRDGGFDGSNGSKLFHSYVATSGSDDNVVGYVIFFYSYSTWEGKAIWMEDIYVQPAHRGKGIGTKLWQRVARRADEESCCRLDFAVLKWNEPSIRFYEHHGAVNITDKEEWNVFRLSREAIAKLSAKQI